MKVSKATLSTSILVLRWIRVRKLSKLSLVVGLISLILLIVPRVRCLLGLLLGNITRFAFSSCSTRF